MKRINWVRAAAVLAAAVFTIVFGVPAAESLTAQSEISERTAGILQKKIDAIQAMENAGTERPPETVEVSEAELESFVLYGLREDIPAHVESVDVQLTEGAVGADTKLTFAPDSTGNAVVDALIAGTHSVFVKGKMSASAGQGRFELEEVQVDGIPVPTILIETLVAKYVNPEYPDVDLNEPFKMPWGIESLTITPGKATIVY